MLPQPDGPKIEPPRVDDLEMRGYTLFGSDDKPIPRVWIAKPGFEKIGKENIPTIEEETYEVSSVIIEEEQWQQNNYDSNTIETLWISSMLAISASFLGIAAVLTLQFRVQPEGWVI